MLNLSLKYISFTFLFLFVNISISSAAPPDAGGILNEQQQMQQSIPDRLQQGEGQGESKTFSSDTDVKVLVKGFHFSGFEGLAEETELQKIAADAIGQELSFAQLQQLASRVTNYLKKEKGYLLARAYLPQQDVTEGTVEIAIIAGRLEGKAVIDMTGDSRIKPDILEGIAARAVSSNEALRLAKLERAVLLINDLPGLSAKASIEQGETSGTSQVIINVSEGRLIDTAVNMDNYGDRYTGCIRGGAQLSVNDPWGLGDQLSLNLNKAQRLNQARIDYGLPLGRTGLNGSLYYSYLNYKIGQEMEILDAKGTAQSIGASVIYPVIRSRRVGLWTTLGLDRAHLKDEALDAATGDRKVLSAKAGFSSNIYDGFGGGGMTASSLNLYYGNIDLSGLKIAKDYDEAGPDTAGGYWRAAYSIARLQRLTKQMSFFISARGQFSEDNLDSSQKFILGGPTGVRAYPVGEASGDDGHMMTAEVRCDLPLWGYMFNTQLVSFMDTGIVHLHNNPWTGSITNATGSNRYVLSGWGVGINLSRTEFYSIRASYARAMGANDGRNQDGTNVDNQRDRGRFWLQAVMWF